MFQHQLFCCPSAAQRKASLLESAWHSSSSLSVSHSNTSSFLFRLQMGEASCYLVRWIGMIFSFTYTFLLQIFLLLPIGCYIPVSFKFGGCWCTTTVLLTRGRHDIKIRRSTHIFFFKNPQKLLQIQYYRSKGSHFAFLWGTVLACAQYKQGSSSLSSTNNVLKQISRMQHFGDFLSL